MKTIICEKRGPYLRCTLLFRCTYKKGPQSEQQDRRAVTIQFGFIKRRTKKAKQLSRTKNKDKSQLLRYTMPFC